MNFKKFMGKIAKIHNSDSKEEDLEAEEIKIRM